jgi:hypothetical protein
MEASFSGRALWVAQMWGRGSSLAKAKATIRRPSTAEGSSDDALTSANGFLEEL